MPRVERANLCELEMAMVHTADWKDTELIMIVRRKNPRRNDTLVNQLFLVEYPLVFPYLDSLSAPFVLIVTSFVKDFIACKSICCQMKISMQLSTREPENQDKYVGYCQIYVLMKTKETNCI